MRRLGDNRGINCMAFRNRAIACPLNVTMTAAQRTTAHTTGERHGGAEDALAAAIGQSRAGRNAISPTR